MTKEQEMPRHVLVTGAGGNLGAKTVRLLAGAPWCEKITAVHSPRKPAPAPEGKVTSYNADLADPSGEWRACLESVDAVVHFAAQRPVPESGWEDAVVSTDMTVNLGLTARDAGVTRFINCSSNHAIGGYKDAPLNDRVQGGGMHEALPPAPGTKWHNGTIAIDSTPYGASKVFAERFFMMLAGTSGGRMSTISLRIGWALPDENDPRQISVSGSPTGQGATEAMDPEEARTLRWFRNMWISNDDFDQLITRALISNASDWSTPSLILNGISDNSGTDWSLDTARTEIGYQPQDDIYAHVTNEEVTS